VLFLGGLIVAAGIEHSQLHRRIAISILRVVGTNPRLLMLGKNDFLSVEPRVEPRVCAHE